MYNCEHFKDPSHLKGSLKYPQHIKKEFRNTQFGVNFHFNFRMYFEQ